MNTISLQTLRSPFKHIQGLQSFNKVNESVYACSGVMFFFEGSVQKTSTDDWQPWLLVATGAKHHGPVPWWTMVL